MVQKIFVLKNVKENVKIGYNNTVWKILKYLKVYYY